MTDLEQPTATEYGDALNALASVRSDAKYPFIVGYMLGDAFDLGQMTTGRVALWRVFNGLDVARLLPVPVGTCPRCKAAPNHPGSKGCWSCIDICHEGGADHACGICMAEATR